MVKFFNVRIDILLGIGAVGSFIAQLYGGWTMGMTALVITMVVDYITGLIVAGVFHNSEKTEDGRLESRAGWKGLVRKCVTLLLILVAVQVDIVLKAGNFTRDAMVICFFANECVSVVENAGLMGIPLPRAFMEAIEVLKNKGNVSFNKPEEE